MNDKRIITFPSICDESLFAAAAVLVLGILCAEILDIPVNPIATITPAASIPNTILLEILLSDLFLLLLMSFVDIRFNNIDIF